MLTCLMKESIIRISNCFTIMMRLFHEAVRDKMTAEVSCRLVLCDSLLFSGTMLQKALMGKENHGNVSHY